MLGQFFWCEWVAVFDRILYGTLYFSFRQASAKIQAEVI